MLLTIKYFGRLQEVTHQDQAHYDLPPAGTVAELIQYVHQEHPALRDQSFQVAVNRKIAPVGHLLQAEDEVALLPPFSGG